MKILNNYINNLFILCNINIIIINFYKYLYLKIIKIKNIIIIKIAIIEKKYKIKVI